MSRRKKPTFILKIDPNLVHTKYDFDLISNISSNVGENGPRKFAKKAAPCKFGQNSKCSTKKALPIGAFWSDW